MRAMAGAVLGTMLGLAACSHGEKRPVTQVEKAPLPAGPDALQSVVEQADASEPGRVASVQDGFLVLDPYRSSLEKERLRLPDQAKVLEGQNEVGLQNLQPGTDVRVFYKFPKGEEPPQVVGVKVLDPEEAKAAEDASHEPPKPQ